MSEQFFMSPARSAVKQPPLRRNRQSHILTAASSALSTAAVSSASSLPVPNGFEGGRGKSRDGRVLLLLLLLLFKMVLFAATRVEAETSFDILSTVNWHST
jgi:hypothetical protein